MAERRQLGLAAATAEVTGQSTALGIFLTPATMAKALWFPAAPILFVAGRPPRGPSRNKLRPASLGRQ